MANQQFERTDRIASEIMRETEKIIREDVSDPRTDCMFSITHVDVTRDLRYAKVYVSVYEEEKRAPMMKALKTAAGFIRHNLGRRVQLRYTPELVFELDTTIEYGVHIASLINQVDGFIRQEPVGDIAVGEGGGGDDGPVGDLHTVEHLVALL